MKKFYKQIKKSLHTQMNLKQKKKRHKVSCKTMKWKWSNNKKKFNKKKNLMKMTALRVMMS